MSRPVFTRRAAATAVAALALVVPALATVVTADLPTNTYAAGSALERLNTNSACPGELIIPGERGRPDSCAHEDEAPPGVDVNKPVRTAVLETREGSAEAAVNAAEDQGVPTAATHAAVSDRVPCEGDGTSGYRVQAVYVVAADKANRFSSVQDQIKQWAAGVNTVFNLSAAKTGGVRDVRFVTAPNGDGTCSPTVLNVTLPAGSNASFNSTISAMQNAGYNSPARKYLMWVDATGYCGIAQTYLSSTPGQDNPNNGRYPQFARTDTACWGLPESVEAHELSHTLGSVQGDAPHATRNGHCWDESDRMCYNDGSGVAMQQICTGDQEVLFDCNDDDYYSTYPPAGSYLATHWNTANSRFLIGGGDGVGGGSLGVPTRLGGTMSINNPAIPGLPTQVALNLEVPEGRSTNVTWTASRSDCVFGDKTAAQTTITCDAKTATQATVTATVTDSAGEKITRSTALTFATTPRTGQATLAVDSTTTPTYVSCQSGKAVLSTTVTDQNTGVPVKGVPVTWYRQVGTATPAVVGSGITKADGVASTQPVVLTAGAYTAKTTTATAFPSMTTSKTDVTIASGACATALTANADTSAVQAGQPATFTGTLTRTVPNGVTAPAVGERVSVYAQYTGSTTWSVAGAATTAADGSYTFAVKPLRDATFQLRFPARTGFQASASPSLPVAVTPWETALSANLSATNTAAGDPVTVTGTLTQSDGETTTPMPSTPVSVVYPLAGGKTAVASGTTNASGNYSIIIKPTGSGTLTARYLGKPGWSAATTTRALSISEWDTTVTVNPSVSESMAGSAVTITGTLTQASDGVTKPLPSSTVAVTYPLAGGKFTTVSATTNASGAYSVTAKPTGSGTITARYAGKPGWAAASATTALTVNEWTTDVTVTASASEVMTGTAVTVTGVLSQSDGSTSKVFPSVPVSITYPLAGGKTGTVSATTTTSGRYTAVIRPSGTGPVTVRYVGKPGWAPTSTATAVTVHTYETALTMTATRNASTGVVTVTGTLRGTDMAGTTVAKPSASIQVTYQYSATRTATVNATTNSTGQFTVTVKPGVTGNISARYAGMVGWDPATAPPVTITVP